MRQSTARTWLKRFAGIGLLVAGSIAVVAYARWAIRLDPFARFRPGDARSPAMQVGVRLEDVKLWHWSNGKLAMSCEVGRVDVRRDRQHLDFYDVRNGIYFGSKESFHFSGPKANYNAGLQAFQVTSGARVWGKDFDLNSEGLNYRQRLGKLATQGAVTGRLFDGQVSATNLLYFPDTKDFEAGPITWEGKLKPFQEAGDDQSKPWQVKAKYFKRHEEEEVWTDGEATDGEVIVKAPNIERNTKTDVLTATGGVHYYSKKANLICEKAVVYRREKRAVLTGAVSMLIKPEDQEKLEVVEIEPFRPMVPEEIAASRPKPPAAVSEEQKKQNEELRSSKSARKYPTSVGAEKIEYWYKKGDRHAIITGSPQARQEMPNGRWRHMGSFKAFYDAEKETLKLVSTEGKKDTWVKTSIGDDLVATWFQTSTKDKGPDEWEGEGVEGTVVSDDEDLNNREKKNPPPKNTGPPPLKGRIGKGRF